MKIISRGHFKDHMTKYLRLAETETIVITVCKEPKFVIVSQKEYTALVFAAIGLKEVT